MIVRVFFGALVAAVLMFVWGFVFWGVLPTTDRLMAPLPSESDVIAALRQAGLGTGMYVYPQPADMDDEEALAVHREQHLAGPILQIAFQAEGGEPMPPQQYLNGLTHFFAVALLAGSLLALAREALPTYGKRLLFVILLGLLTTVWAHWADAIWWVHPWTYVIGYSISVLVSALLMGLVLAALIKPSTETVDGGQ